MGAFVFSSIIILLYLIYSVGATVFIRARKKAIITNIDVQGILLTFDDGPNPLYTPQLLDLLKQYNVKACFFVVGSKVEQYPEIVRRIVAEGHMIGIHHYEHISNWVLAPWQLKRQLVKTERAIQACTNEKVVLYRPPWGHFNAATLALSKKYNIMMWSHLFHDWNIVKSKDTMLASFRTASTQGSIFLLHDCGVTLGADEEAPKYMLQNLEVFLQECQQKGTPFINLKEVQMIGAL